MQGFERTTSGTRVSSYYHWKNSPDFSEIPSSEFSLKTFAHELTPELTSLVIILSHVIEDGIWTHGLDLYRWKHDHKNEAKIIYILPTFSEPCSAEGLHRDSGPDGDDDRGLLEDGLARAGLLHRHGHEDVRLHQGK